MPSVESSSVPAQPPVEGVRIGELASRTGVSAHTLRVWESRYGLLRPARTVGGYRLYGPDDEARVREVAALRDRGVPAGEAAARVLQRERTHGEEFGAAAGADGSVPPAAAAVEALLAATAALDERAGAAALDEVLASRSVERTVTEVLLPYLRRLGEEWAAGRMTVVEEHFGSSLVRRRLSTLTQAWGNARGPLAVLACPPGEAHDLALLAFGVLLGRGGWRVRHVGADTPVSELAEVCDRLRPDLVVLAATRAERFTHVAADVAALAQSHVVALAGRGATPGVLASVGAHRLDGDPVTALAEAARLAGLAGGRSR